MQGMSSPGTSNDDLQKLLAVESEGAMTTLLGECPEIAELEPGLIVSRLIWLKVITSLHA